MFFRKYWLLLLLLVVSLGIRIFSAFPYAVETYYSQHIYPGIAIVQRFLFGWIPFSVGDILYALAVIYLIKGLVQFIQKIFKKSINRQYVRRMVKRTAYIVLWVYVIFNLGWGLNYNRLGISRQLGLKVTPYNIRITGSKKFSYFW